MGYVLLASLERWPWPWVSLLPIYGSFCDGDEFWGDLKENRAGRHSETSGF